MRYLLLPMLLLASCYQPKIASGTFTCAAAGDRCPDGQHCSGGVCVNPGEDRDLAEADLAEEPRDLAGADLAGADLAVIPPDLAVLPDLAGGADLAVDPCAAGWSEISAGKIYACRRTFAVAGGAFAGLCRSGYHVCTAADDLAVVGTDAGALRCATAGGFYMTALDIALRNVSGGGTRADGVCMPQAADMPRALLGCGIDANLVRLNGNASCSGLRTAMRCGATAGGWSCTSAKDAKHTSAPGGLLCCAGP